MSIIFTINNSNFLHYIFFFTIRDDFESMGQKNEKPLHKYLKLVILVNIYIIIIYLFIYLFIYIIIEFYLISNTTYFFILEFNININFNMMIIYTHTVCNLIILN